jgi:hypothetical protein
MEEIIFLVVVVVALCSAAWATAWGMERERRAWR